MIITKVIILFSLVLCSGWAKQGFGPGDQDWGYVTVREKAHMFWWLFYTPVTTSTVDKPLIIWLQGGPGSSSTGRGNFEEIGPLTVSKTSRTSAWTNFADILFVDNPVGTGFSYVENGTHFASNNTQIAEDFIVFLREFFKLHSEYANVPFYIFGQSYGGKMAVDIALHITKQTEFKSGAMNLTGIGLGGAWISPMDSLNSWSSYLLNLGFIDNSHFDLLNLATNYGQTLFDSENYANVTQVFRATQILIRRYAGRVNFYNVMEEIPEANSYFRNNQQDVDNFYLPLQDEEDAISLDQLMNNEVAPALHIAQIWGVQSDDVFKAVEVDFMKPVTQSVEEILNNTDITVTVYNGQLDLIVPTIGTEKWVKRLKWCEAEAWNKTADDRKLLALNEVVEGYERSIGNLQFYWVNRAGHSVPADNPRAMEYILRRTTKNFTVHISKL